MADFSQLKAAVANVIKTNGNEEITGAILQDVLLTIINSIAGGYMFGGVAQHSGNVGNPDYNVFYLAGSGSYTGYGSAITIENGCYGVFRYNGSWTQEVVDIGVRLSGSVTAGETRGCTGDTINSALQQLFDNITTILDTLSFVYNTPSAQQATKAMLDVQVTVGGNAHVLGTLTLVAATALQAGLMSAEDKQTLDGMLNHMAFEDTTAGGDVTTKITEALKATIGGNAETLATFTILAATASKAGLMSADDKVKLDTLVAMLGYYECSTAAGTAAKTVSASGYVLTTGGCIRIKMTNANTADNVTLNINSTGAKALYYDGAQASSSNSWDAGDILEVFYDGTQYQCASGGGGKFATGEAVKDVAITDIVTKDSDDLVTSGGVDGAFRGGTKTETYGSDDATVSGILKWDGTVGSYGGWYTSAKISVEGAKTLVATGLYYSSSTYMGLALYDANDNVIYRNTAADISLNMSSYPTASYMRFCRNSQTPSITLTIDYGLLSQVTSKAIVEGDNMPVSGGAVKRGFDAVNMELNGAETTYDTDDCTPNTLLKANGTTQTYNNYYTSDFIAVSQNYVMYCTNLYANDGYYHGLHFYDDNKASASVQPPSGSAGYIDFADYPTVKYIRFCGQSGAEITLVYNNAIRPKLNEIYPTAKNLGMLFNLSDGTFGITEVVSGTSTLANNFPVVTAAHSASSMTGLLSKIKIKVNAAGKFKVGVGILDQNNIPVIREALTVEAQYAGYNEIDTSSLNFIIKESEQLFIIYDGNLSSVKPQYMQTNNSAYAEDNCPYGTLSGLSYYGVSGTYIVFTLAYDVVEIDSVFAMKSQIEELQQELTSVQQNSIIWDEDGIPYRLRVENGVVVPVAQVFKKVVILGNSLTWHEYNASIGWYGKNRSMASTTNDTSWPYMFERILKKKQPTATVTGVMMRNWETAGDGNRNINNIPSTKALLDAALAADVDLIIFRCGENGTVSSATTYAQEIKSLIDYCLNTATNAQVVLCGLFFPNATKDEAILSVANNYHYQYITAGNAFGSNQEINGDYMVDSEDGQQKRIGSACLSHTNDYGFYMWTNHIASQLGYGNELLDELYEVNISSTLSNPYRIKNTKSPYKSLVTILVQESSQPTVSVTAGGTSVQTTIHELTNAGAFTYAITFIQPESDVTVTLS